LGLAKPNERNGWSLSPGQAIREGLKDGRVTDIWTQFDGVALLQQLGAMPA
jgi:hypothetical protein